MKILIADDDLTSRVMLEGLIRKWGFDPIVAEDGEAAWGIIQSDNSPQLLLLDWEMPKVNGIKLCQLIREKENNTNNPSFIILLTSRNETNDIVAGLDAGANEYIVKPFAYAELRARLGVGVRVLQLQAEQASSEQDLQIFKRIFKTALEGIMITDNDKIIVDINPAFCDMTGYSRDEAIGQPPSLLSSGKQSSQFYQFMMEKLEEAGHWQGEICNRKKNGELYVEQLFISTLRNENSLVKNYVGIFSDITYSKKQEEKLKLMAHYDLLTKLPNRALFADRFKQAIAHSKRSETLLAICFLDLDNFKPVNDNFGHEMGDKLLIEVADRIKSSIREEDTVSRQGGDEFAILLGNLDDISQSEVLLKRLHSTLSLPYLINGENIEIGASSGYTIYPLDNADLDTLMRHADQAMYVAKLAGKNRSKLFNIEDDNQAVIKQE